MENTDFVIEHIDEEVQVIADQPSVVTNYPANTDFFIENIDSNVISIAHSLNIEASEVDFRPANTDFFIENIDKNVIAIAESMSLSPSEVDFRPANTDFFVENIDKNLNEIAKSLSLTPYEVTIRPANTDMFIENIDKNVTLIKGSTNVVTVSGDYININIPDGGKVQSAQIDGNATQTTYSGKNLLPFTNQDYTLSGVRVYVQDGELYLNGTSTANVSSNSSYWKTSFAFTLPAGTYTFGASEYTFTQIEQFFMHKADQTDLGFIKEYTAKTVTFTLEEETSVYLGIFWANGSVFNNKKISITLNSGSTAQPYERYVGGIPAPNPSYPQPISVVTGENVVKVVGKNLLPTIVGSATRSGVTISADNGTVTASGSATADMTFTLTGNGIKYDRPYFQAILATSDNSVLLDAGTYYFSGNIQSNNVSLIMRLVEDGAALSSGRAVTANSTFTIATQKRFCIAVYVDNGKTPTLSLSNLQLELGSTATAYEPYQGQEYTIDLGSIELTKIGTYQDRIYKEGEKWYAEKRTGSIVLDGSETWQSQTGPHVVISNLYTAMTGWGALPQKVQVLCSIATYSGSAGGNNDRIANICAPNSTGSNFLLDLAKTEFPDIAALTSYLSTNPITVYYVLATPTTTEITDQTLIDQLEALASASLNQGVNNIFTEIATGNAMPTLELVIEKY